jgi:chromosomal replication initiator protein
VLTVATPFHAQGLTKYKDLIERAMRAHVVSVQTVRRTDLPPAQRNQQTLSLRIPRPVMAAATSAPQVAFTMPPKAPVAPAVDPRDIEGKRRSPAPHLISSPVFDMPVQMLKRWTESINSGARAQALWLHGKPGSGKTHLAKQLSRFLDLRKRLVVVDTMSFFHEWRRALESKEQPAFIRKYRKDVDLLVLENIDQLQGKSKTQEEVLYTIQDILERGGHVAVTSSVHPMTMQPMLLDSLFSRMLSGLAIEMPTPDRAFKEHFWRYLLDHHGLKEMPLDLMVQERLLNIPVDSVRSVNTLCINAISRISFRGRLTMGDIMEFESQISPRQSVGSEVQKPLDMIEAIARICGVGLGALQGNVRRANITLARRFACLALQRFLGLTNASIADYIGKDPSTVSHALKLVEEELKTDRHVSSQWTYICAQLGRDPSTKDN